MLVYWSYSRVKKRPFLQRGQQWTARRHVIWPWMRRMQVSDLVVAQPFYLVNWRESQQKLYSLYSMSIPNCKLHPQLGLCSPQNVVICSYDFYVNWFPPMKQARSCHQSGVEIGHGWKWNTMWRLAVLVNSFEIQKPFPFISRGHFATSHSEGDSYSVQCPESHGAKGRFLCVLFRHATDVGISQLITIPATVINAFSSQAMGCRWLAKNAPKMQCPPQSSMVYHQFPS